MIKALISRISRYHLVALIAMLINLSIAARFVVNIPIVDGWSVLHRILLLDSGEISFFDFIFSYFGAHPHSIIMFSAWLDFNLFQGEQTLLASLSFLSIIVFGFFCIERFIHWSSQIGAANVDRYLGVITIAAFTTSLADRQLLTIPFHFVLSGSRLTYILLIWFLIKNLCSESQRGIHLITLLSCVAVTFHGSGYFFALLVLLSHLLLYRKWQILLLAPLPTLTATLQNYFYSNGGELSSLPKVLSLEKIGLILRTVFAYFATPMAPLIKVVGENTLLSIGAGAFTITLVITINCLIKTIRARLNNTNLNEIRDVTFLGVVGLFVLLIATAGALLMTIRLESEAPNITLKTSRYVAFSFLSYIFILCSIIKFGSLRSLPAKIGAVTLTALITTASIYPTIKAPALVQTDIQLNKAIAAISTGVSPLKKPGDYIWPRATDDWYWVNALPKTVEYFHRMKKGPWFRLPKLDSQYIGTKDHLPFQITSTSKHSEPEICSISGQIKDQKKTWYKRSKVSPIIDSTKHVIGFGAIYLENKWQTLKIDGFIPCIYLNNLGQINLILDENRENFVQSK